MHKLLEYICDELEKLERKADKEGKLSMQEVQYMDTLAHAKKNILTADAMTESEYSNDNMSYARGRNARRDSMGRYSRGGSYDDRSYMGNSMNRGGSYGANYGRNYSRDNEELVGQLREMEMNAQDEETRRMIQEFIRKAEK